jgi:ATP-dependent RNA helicase DDX10/DBP4
VYLQRDKEVFNLTDLPLEEYAESLGLPTVPHVKFIPGNHLKQAKNAPHTSSASISKVAKSKYDKMAERKNQTVLTEHYEAVRAEGNTAFKVPDQNDPDEEIFSKKRKVDWEDTNIATGTVPVSSPTGFL